MLPELTFQNFEHVSVPLKLGVPETELIDSLRGQHMIVPLTPVDELVDTVVTANASTTTWMLNAETHPGNWLGEGARIEWAKDLHVSLEELCDSIVQLGALPYKEISNSVMHLNKLGINIILAQALRNAGHDQTLISNVISDTNFNNQENVKLLWAYESDGPMYDFNHLPVTITNFAIMIADEVGQQLSSGQSPMDQIIPKMLVQEFIERVQIEDWDNLTIQDWDSIFTYLITKIINRELVFANIPMQIGEQGAQKRTVLKSAILLPALK